MDRRTKKRGSEALSKREPGSPVWKQCRDAGNHRYGQEVRKTIRPPFTGVDIRAACAYSQHRDRLVTADDIGFS
jgi:hypothetical protein